MADVEISRTHHMSLAAARKVAQEVADELGEEYGLESEWDGNVLNFSRTGVKGSLTVTDKTMEVQVNLGFMFRIFASKFESAISHNMDRLIAEPPPSTKAASKSASKTTNPASKAPATKSAAKTPRKF
jgi:putative polyhydroxyalkanoate system protein